MKKLIDSFKAADADGKIYQIDLYQDFETIRTLSGSEQVLPKRQEYFCGGSPVTLTGDQTFYIVALDTEVKKVN